MGTQEALTLQRESRLILQRDIDGCTGLKDTLVQNRHGTHHIIDRIINILYQCRTSCGHFHRSAWHIHGVESNLIPCRTFVFTG